MEGVQGVAGDMNVQALALGYRGLAGGADHQGLVAAGQAHMKVALGAGGLEELQGGRKGQVGARGGSRRSASGRTPTMPVPDGRSWSRAPWTAVPGPLSRASRGSRFMAGEPIKVATKSEAGRA